MKSWIEDYLKDQARVALALPVAEIEEWIRLLRTTRDRKARIFACGNGGSAANCSHFAVDLGKGGSGVSNGSSLTGNAAPRFQVLSLNDNVSWMTALGNDCSYGDIFVEQLKNYAVAGDVVIGVSVSGNSPNVVNALKWASHAGLTTLGLVGNRENNEIARIANRVISVDSGHYGRVEDAQMHVLHLLCYAFIEGKAV
jgi:D-sedoheptulose 7-phosphate isomerase